MVFLLAFVSHFNTIAQPSSKIDSLANILNKGTDCAIVCDALLDMGLLYEDSLPNTALMFYNRALYKSKQCKLSESETSALSSIAYIYSITANHKKALDYYGQELACYDSVLQATSYCVTLSNMAYSYRRLNFPDSALVLYDRAIVIYEMQIKQGEKNSVKAIAGVYNNLAITYEESGDFSSAAKSYSLAAKYYEEAGDAPLKASVLLNLGGLFDSWGRYSDALRLYQEAYNLFEEFGDTIGIAGSCSNIGILHYKHDNLENALEYFLKALKYHSEADNVGNMAIAYTNLGSVYSDLGMADSCIMCYRKAIYFDNLNNDFQGLAIDYSNIASQYNDMAMQDSAYKYYRKSESLLLSASDVYSLAGLYNNIASFFLKANQPDSCIKYVKKAISLAETDSILPVLKTAFYSQARANEMKGLHKEAIQSYQIYKSIKDTLFNIDRHRQFEEMETIYQSDKKDKVLQKQELRLQAQDLEAIKKQSEIEYQRTVLITLLGSAILLVFVVVFFLFSYLKIKTINKLLSNQKKEIEEKNKGLLEQNTEIERQKEELESAVKDLELTRNELIESEMQMVLVSLISDFSEKIRHPVLNAAADILEFSSDIIRLRESLKENTLSGEELREKLQNAYQATGSGLKLLTEAGNTVESFKQISSDQMIDEQREVIVSDLIQEIIAGTSYRLKQRNVNVAVDGAPVSAVTFPGVLGKVILILIDNALEHAFENVEDPLIDIRISASNIERTGQDAFSIAILDNGLVLPTTVREKLFMAFNMGPGKKTNGLGLHVLNNLVVKRLYGDVKYMEDKNKKGFILTIPLIAIV